MSTSNGDIQPAPSGRGPFRLIDTPAEHLFQALASAVVALDLDGRIDFANLSATRLFDGPVVGREFSELLVPPDREMFASYLHSLYGITGAGESRYTTCGLFREDAKGPQIAIAGAPVRHGDQVGLLLNLTDITLQQEREAALMSMALTDSLTALPNRRSFVRSLGQAINAGNGCVVALADIDRFKTVNDQYGHAVGDRVICAVASSIVMALPAHAVVARMGGDEFAVLLPGEVDDYSLRQLESLRQIELPSDIQLNGPRTVSLSIGVTHTTAGTENDVFRQSDVAMYAAKANGRAQVAVFGERATAILLHHQSITELVKNLRSQNEQLHLEARTDARTGLANSRALSEVEGHVIGTAESEWPACGVIFVDIDHFGAFNHLYGDHAGDVALKRVAEALRRAGRTTDQVFRKGGEEFVMVLPLADPDAVGRVARQLAECISDLRIPHAEGPTGWLSALIVGVNVWPGEAIRGAIARAGDAAMRCKSRGVRAQVVLIQADRETHPRQ